MRRINNLFFLLCCGTLFALLGSCATTGIPKQIRSQADPDVSFPQVRADPDAYKGKTVLWGGEILTLKNSKDGTYLEILQAPTDKKGNPGKTELSEGRFIAYTERYLDKLVYTSRRRVTVVGEVKGMKVQPLGQDQVDYPYPLIHAKHIHLWPVPEPEPARPPVSIGVGFGYSYGFSPYWRSRWGLGWDSPLWYDPFYYW